MRETAGIVLEELGKPPSVEKIQLEGPGPNEVLIHIAASGVCHTDLGYLHYARACPVVLGHEGAGVVEMVGERVDRIQPGDHVVVNWQPKCGSCRWCRAGRQDLCEDIKGTEAPRAFWRGNPIHVMLNAGTFSTYIVVPANGAVVIRKDMPLEKAAMLGCAVATGVGAVLHTADVQLGEDVIVIGSGGVGLNVIQGARLVNAGKIIAIDIDEERLSLAKRLGATHTINARKGNIIEYIQDLTNGRGVEHVFEAVGSTSLMQQGLEMLARGGKLTFIGAADRIAKMEFFPRRFMSQQQSIVGCIYGNIRPHIDLPLFADWYMDGRLKLDELHTSTISLEEVPEMFTRETPTQGIRTIIRFGKGEK
jgi:S-(hydroxymethyl)glutathione dehydrogenase / alcohol dehydrogenase